jgi:hypothetical protein
MSITEIQLYTALKQRLGEEQAQQLVEFVKAEVKDEMESRAVSLATKEDLARIEVKIAEAKVDIIKWMVATAIAVVGLVIAGVKLL